MRKAALLVLLMLWRASRRRLGFDHGATVRLALKYAALKGGE